MIYPSGWCLFLCHLASIQCRANIPTALWQLCIQSIFSAEGTKLSIINYCLFSLFVQTKAFAASLMMITLNEVSQQSLHWHNFPSMYPFWINKKCVLLYCVLLLNTKNDKRVPFVTWDVHSFEINVFIWILPDNNITVTNQKQC